MNKYLQLLKDKQTTKQSKQQNQQKHQLKLSEDNIQLSDVRISTKPGNQQQQLQSKQDQLQIIKNQYGLQQQLSVSSPKNNNNRCCFIDFNKKQEVENINPILMGEIIQEQSNKKSDKKAIIEQPIVNIQQNISDFQNFSNQPYQASNYIVNNEVKAVQEQNIKQGNECKNKSKVVLEIEKMQQNRQQRRVKFEEIRREKAEKKAELEQSGKNVDVEYEQMINNERFNKQQFTPHSYASNLKLCVCVRKRPIFSSEQQNGEIDSLSCANPQIRVHEPKLKIDGITKFIENYDFQFDNSFGEFESTEEVYRYSLQSMIELVLNKGFITCFAYGQTGSGKTYTMKGLQDLFVNDIYRVIKSEKYKKLGLHLNISYFEIYGGKCFDLFNNREPLNILEDKNNYVQIPNLTECVVNNVNEMLQLIEKGNEARTTHATTSNEESSRSHAICTLKILDSKTNFQGKLVFVDLAGSERAQQCQSNDKQRRFEGAEINKSLLALKECIRSIDQNAVHVPFRGSKLTLVLRDSFQNKYQNSKIIMIACVSPGSSSADHTLNTLRYADRLKESSQIQIKPYNFNNYILPKDRQEQNYYQTESHLQDNDEEELENQNQQIVQSENYKSQTIINDKLYDKIEKQTNKTNKVNDSPKIKELICVETPQNKTIIEIQKQLSQIQSKIQEQEKKFSGQQTNQYVSQKQKEDNKQQDLNLKQHIAQQKVNQVQPKSPEKKPQTRESHKQKNTVVDEIKKLKIRRDERRQKMQEQKKEKAEKQVQNELLGKNVDIDFQILIDQQKLSQNNSKPHVLASNFKLCVCVRKRPIFDQEMSNGEIDSISCSNPNICIHAPKFKVDGITKYVDNQNFYFDNAFSETEDTYEIYENSLQSLIDFIINQEGVVTCFAYGQTGSGKTFTMRGLQQYFVQDLQEVQQNNNDNQYVFSVSFYEIYGGKAYDLLNNREQLVILEDKNNNVQIPNLVNHQAQDASELLNLIQFGNTARTTHATITNEVSSRSHAICTITVHNLKQKLQGKLVLVDLAGSERAQLCQSNDKQRRLEGAEINKSLLALKECIRSMDQNAQHIPFRTSKLTLVLRDSFLGKSSKSKIIMIACVSPGSSSTDHSLNTLRYADRLKENNFINQNCKQKQLNQEQEEAYQQLFQQDIYLDQNLSYKIIKTEPNPKDQLFNLKINLNNFQIPQKLFNQITIN